METYLASRNSSVSHRPPSRPNLEYFAPPKGAQAVEGRPSLMPTIPYSSDSATRKVRPRSSGVIFKASIQFREFPGEILIPRKLPVQLT